LRQPPYGFLDDRRLDLFEFRARFSSHPLRERGTRRDGRRAAARFVARFGGPVALEAHRQPQNIATHGIRDFDRDRGRRQVADVARILEMIEKALAVHAGRVFQYFMQFEPRQVHARNSASNGALSIRALRGSVALIDFWDSTGVNCIGTLPYVRAW